MFFTSRAIANSLLSFVLIAFIVSYSHSQSVSLMPAWQDGDEVKYDIYYSMTRYEEQATVRQENINYKMTITTLDSLESGHIFSWEFTGANYKASVVPQEEKYNDIITRLIEGSKIVYKTDKSGAFSEFMNYQSVKMHFATKTYQKALELEHNKSLDKKDFISAVESKLKSRRDIEKQYERMMMIFHAPYGMVYKKDSTIIVDGEVSGIFGDLPLNSHNEFSLLSVDTTSKQCFIEILQEYDEESLKKALSKIMKSKKSSNTFSTDELPEIRVFDKARYTVNYITGRIESLAHERKIIEGNTLAIENTIFTLQND